MQRGWDGGAAGEQFTVPQFASTTAGGIPLFHTSGSQQAAAAAAGGGAAPMEGSGASGPDQQQAPAAQPGAAAAPGAEQQPQQEQQLDGIKAEGLAEPGPLHVDHPAVPAAGAAGGAGPPDFGLHADPLGAGMGDHHGPSPLLRVGSGAGAGRGPLRGGAAASRGRDGRSTPLCSLQRIKDGKRARCFAVVPLLLCIPLLHAKPAPPCTAPLPFSRPRLAQEPDGRGRARAPPRPAARAAAQL